MIAAREQLAVLLIMRERAAQWALGARLLQH